jgi:hypothetical protein
MEKSQSKNNYIYIALAVLVLLAVIAMAFLRGRRDGAEHRSNQTNQASNKTQ